MDLINSWNDSARLCSDLKEFLCKEYKLKKIPEIIFDIDRFANIYNYKKSWLFEDSRFLPLRTPFAMSDIPQQAYKTNIHHAAFNLVVANEVFLSRTDIDKNGNTQRYYVNLQILKEMTIHDDQLKLTLSEELIESLDYD